MNILIPQLYQIYWKTIKRNCKKSKTKNKKVNTNDVDQAW